MQVSFFYRDLLDNNRLKVNFIQNVGLQNLHFLIKCSLTYLYFLFIYFCFLALPKDTRFTANSVEIISSPEPKAHR